MALEGWEIVVDRVSFIRLVPMVISSVGKIEIVDADVVDLQGVVLAVCVPRWIPFVSFLPKGEHLLLAFSRPRLLVALVNATIREEVASDGHVQNEVELHNHIIVIHQYFANTTPRQLRYLKLLAETEKYFMKIINQDGIRTQVQMTHWITANCYLIVFRCKFETFAFHKLH